MDFDNVYDVIIVGGGLAGCATALAFHRSKDNASFLLLDDADPTSFKIGESLPPEASRILHYLSPELPTRLAQDTARGIHSGSTGNASIWESSDLRESFSIMNPFGAGWHLDRALFDESLRDAVRTVCLRSINNVPSGSTSRLEKARFIGVEKDVGSWIISAEVLESNEKRRYRSKWIIDATGRKASLARKLGAKTLKNDALLAFYALFRSSVLDEDHRTLIEATETGWWYTSQLSNNIRVVVYHTDDIDPSSKRARKREGFLELLYNDTTYISQIMIDNDYRLLLDSNFPRCTASCSSYLEPPVDEIACWTAVGDAAMAFDPLSSQGMITALRMGCSVGKMLGRKLDAVKSKEYPEDKPSDSIEQTFLTVRKDYEGKKKYFYTQARFDGDFWMARR